MFLTAIHKWVLRLTSTITFLVSLFVVGLLIYRFGYPQSASSLVEISNGFGDLLLIQWFCVTFQLVFGNISTERKKSLFQTLSYISFTIVTGALFVIQFKLLAVDNFLKFLTSDWSVIFVLLLISVLELSRAVTNILGKRTNPAMIIAVSFAFVIFAGSLLLGLPNCSYDGLAYIDSLFVSASAVCVTGLTTIDISSSLTFTGQIVLLLLIQAGGLGIMTLTSFFGLFFSGGSFSNQLVVQDLINSDKMNGLLRYALRIIIVTLIVEGVGALLIYLSMVNNSALSHGDAIFFSIFHSISAFCNAGFSTLHGNLYDPVVGDISSVIWTISWLIIFGGIGFPIFNNFIRTIGLKLRNYVRVIFGKRRLVHKHLWELNTFIVVRMTAILLVCGWVFFLFVEWQGVLGEYDFWGKLSQGFLMSVTPRTAGFNGVNVSSMLPASIFMTIILMWIGGAPQSTAGGIKVTTFYLALKNILSTSGVYDRVEVKGREIPQSSIRRALGVIFASLLVISVSITIIALQEPRVDLGKIIFEVFSAIGTVGMSMGITSQLSSGSKLVLILLMFIGRVGIVSLILSFVKRNGTPRHYRLPQENILIN